MEEKLEAAYGDQKRIFLIIFQRFIMILSEHLVKCDTDGRDYNTDWYRWTIGRLQQVFLVVSRIFEITESCFFKITISSPAPRTSPEIFKHFGKSSLHSSWFTHLGRFPAVRRSQVLITFPKKNRSFLKLLFNLQAEIALKKECKKKSPYKNIQKKLKEKLVSTYVALWKEKILIE